MCLRALTRRRLLAFALGAALAGTATDGLAQEAQLPMEVQISLFARIWTFDRRHEARSDDELVIAVIYQGDVRSSLLAKEDFLPAASRLVPSPGGLRIVEIDYSGPDALEEAIREEGIDLVYVAPLRAVDVGEIAEVARRLSVLTCTGVPDYVSRGIAVGLELSDGRPAILVNREASKQQGADFGSELLELARLVSGDRP